MKAIEESLIYNTELFDEEETKNKKTEWNKSYLKFFVGLCHFIKQSYTFLIFKCDIWYYIAVILMALLQKESLILPKKSSKCLTKTRIFHNSLLICAITQTKVKSFQSLNVTFVHGHIIKWT